MAPTDFFYKPTDSSQNCSVYNILFAEQMQVRFMVIIRVNFMDSKLLWLGCTDSLQNCSVYKIKF